MLVLYADLEMLNLFKILFLFSSGLNLTRADSYNDHYYHHLYIHFSKVNPSSSPATTADVAVADAATQQIQHRHQSSPWHCRNHGHLLHFCSFYKRSTYGCLEFLLQMFKFGSCHLVGWLAVFKVLEMIHSHPPIAVSVVSHRNFGFTFHLETSSSFDPQRLRWIFPAYMVQIPAIW